MHPARNTQRVPRRRFARYAAVLMVVIAACGDAAPGDTTNPPLSPPTDTTIPAPPPMPPETTPPRTAAPDTAPPDTAAPQPGDDCTAEPFGSIHHHVAFFAWCGVQGERPPFPVVRKMDEPDLQTKLELLVRGTKGYEQDRGLHTGFDWIEERSEIEVVTSVDARGVATVDFLIDGTRWSPGARASTSHQYLAFIEPLEATVFSDPEVNELDRSTLCWGESDCVGTTTREEWAGTLFVNYGLTCGLEAVASSSWGCVVGDDPIYRATVVGVAADDVLNMRSGPGIEYFKIGAAAPGSDVDVLDRGRFATDGGFWHVVRNGDGDVGWVNAAFLADAATLADRTPEEQLVDAFVRFAARPSDASFARLPLADTVALGLGADIVEDVPASSLRSTAAWRLDVEDFRAFVGPFSALGTLVHADPYQVTLGEHDHCASPPMPLPAGYEDLNQISIQPRDGTYDSCLMWSTVDFFVNDDGEVEAITLDMWEP